MQLSEHFTLEEMTASQTAVRKGINNTPTGEVLGKLKQTAQMMEQVRNALGGASIHVSSAYRSPRLNKAIGGSSTSQHCTGEAVDFTSPSFGSPKDVALAISRSGIEYDQLIYEGAWVHISFSSRNRRQELTAHFGGGGVRYTDGIAA